MQGMLAGNRSRGKPRQRWEKDITDTFGTMATASRVAEDRRRFPRDIWAASTEDYALRRRIYVYMIPKTLFTLHATNEQKFYDSPNHNGDRFICVWMFHRRIVLNFCQILVSFRPVTAAVDVGFEW